MPRYVIERDVPGAGQLGPEQIQGIAQKSCTVLKELGPEIQWVESYVTDRIREPRGLVGERVQLVDPAGTSEVDWDRVAEFAAHVSGQLSLLLARRTCLVKSNVMPKIPVLCG